MARRALISVTDKTGVAEFAKALEQLGFSILSTGGTARVISEVGVEVTSLEAFTGSPEMLDGRVKTLHPRVHGGILARRDLPDHVEQMKRFELDPIDLVCVNLYDFTGAVAKGLGFEDTIEEIDIGGPTLLRAAAKNHKDVLVLVRPEDYAVVVEALQNDSVDDALRRRLALEVFSHTARYDRAVTDWLDRQIDDAPFPREIGPRYEHVRTLRYGENPHQQAAFYADAVPSYLSSAEVLQGKPLSYNNLLDLDAALGLALDLPEIGAVYIKHNNPCGAALGKDGASALATARACDSLSAFGSVVSLNVRMDRAAAEVLTESFVEAIVAPGYDDDALDVLARKKNLRVLSIPDGWDASLPGQEIRRVRGGALVQSLDAGSPAAEVATAKVVTKRAPTQDELEALTFVWTVGKHVKSNAIVFGRSDRVVAVGAGQMSRVDSVRICRLKNQEALSGTSVASDAFFPFRDGIDELCAAGATAIVQPGGSKRDEEVIRAADEHGVAMVFTGVRHFRH